MKKHQTFLIAFALTMLVGAGYLYFNHAILSEAATPVSPDSSLSTTGSPTGSSGGASSNIVADTAFLNSLISLTSITIDTSLFTNPAFAGLHDNNVTIEPVTPGRENPFAPIAADPSLLTTPVVPVTTNDATQISTTTAVLNGATTSPTAPSSVYFEYGPTPTLGKTTPAAVESLVSTFISKITGLTTKTTYFYRADAKTNGAVVNGPVVSFTTN